MANKSQGGIKIDQEKEINPKKLEEEIVELCKKGEWYTVLDEDKLALLLSHYSRTGNLQGVCFGTYIRGCVYAVEGNMEQAHFDWNNVLMFEVASPEVQEATELALENESVVKFPWEL